MGMAGMGTVAETLVVAFVQVGHATVCTAVVVAESEPDLIVVAYMVVTVASLEFVVRTAPRGRHPAYTSFEA